MFKFNVVTVSRKNPRSFSSSVTKSSYSFSFGSLALLLLSVLALFFQSCSFIYPTFLLLVYGGRGRTFYEKRPRKRCQANNWSSKQEEQRRKKQKEKAKPWARGRLKNKIEPLIVKRKFRKSLGSSFSFPRPTSFWSQCLKPKAARKMEKPCFGRPEIWRLSQTVYLSSTAKVKTEARNSQMFERAEREKNALHRRTP